jgi:hypothetical protein
MRNRKASLPDKLCAGCGRRFTWRRKWAASWPEVRFCSDACRTGRRAAALKRLERDRLGEKGT